MIYSLLLCYLTIKLKSYSQGIQILLFIINIFDLVKGTNLNNIISSQGNTDENPKTTFCKQNLEHLLSYNSLLPLSSNNKPLNQNFSSSTSTTTLLPQGNESVKPSFTITPVFSSVNRIDSDEKEFLAPIVGCIYPRNYNWKNVKTIGNETKRFSDVQIFLFHFYNGETNASTIDINLRILLYSTQDAALNLPVVVVLSSLLPRKFYLSALSFLSYSHQPLHLILTHNKSEVIIADEHLTNEDIKRMDKLFISNIDLSKYDIFQIFSKLKGKDFLMAVYDEIMNKNLFRDGYFYSTSYSSHLQKMSHQKEWLFGSEQHYSKNRPVLKITAIYKVDRNTNFIDLVLGRQINVHNFTNEDFIVDGCLEAKLLRDIIATFQTYGFDKNEDKTCSYTINSSSTSIMIKYRTITWLHIESVSHMQSEIEFVSSHKIDENNNKAVYLVVLTGNKITSSLIKFSSLYDRKIHILTNISRNQFDPMWSDSPWISLRVVDNLTKESFQNHTIASYISGSSSIMQTTIYKFLSNSTSVYRIRLNVDDSNSNSYDNVITKFCSKQSHNNDTVTLIINSIKWKKISNWIPSEFQLGDRSCVFEKGKNGIWKITKHVSQCSSNYDSRLYENKIYGVMKNKTYLLNAKIKFPCKKDNPSSKKKISSVMVTTMLTPDKYIPQLKNGFIISNKSDFKYSLVKPLYDSMTMFVQITNDINGNIVPSMDDIQLRNCYITNRRATINDFQFFNKDQGTFKKLAIIREGCLDNSSHWYKNMLKPLRPINLFKTIGMYRFSIVVDAELWALELSLENQWWYKGQYEVHLYCGINKCSNLVQYNQKSSIPKCRSQEQQCGFDVLTVKQIMKYYGALLIVKHFKNVTLKLYILVVLIAMVLILLICVVVFFCRFYMFKISHFRLQPMNKRFDHRQGTTSEISFCGPSVKPANLDYHSLELVKTNPKRSSNVKFYSEPELIASLRYMIENCDKSLCLQAGYLISPFKDQSHLSLVTTNKTTVRANKKIQSHSVSELNLMEPVLTNWVINSWPLSTTERKVKSQGKNNSLKHNFRSSNWDINNSHKSYHTANRSWHQNNNTNSSGSSNKHKVSYHFNSEMKPFYQHREMSSNRTTVSESMSVMNDIPNKSSSKWWSLLTNYWMNQSIVMSRN